MIRDCIQYIVPGTYIPGRDFSRGVGLYCSTVALKLGGILAH